MMDTELNAKNTEWALEELRCFDGNYKREAMDYALQHQTEITPKLLAILEDVLERPDYYLPPECHHTGPHTHDEDENIWSPLYAITLLSHFREARAHALIAKIFALPEEICEGLFGDMITEDLPALLYSTYPGSPDQMKALILNQEAYDFCRSSAADALAYCVAGGLLDRTEVLDFLATLFTGNEADSDSDFWSQIACTMLDLYPSDHMGTIQRAFSEELIFEGSVDQKCFADNLRRLSPEKCLQKLRTEMARRLPADVHKRLEHWACFREEEETEFEYGRADDFDETSPLVRIAPKIGRNDACPCGSGKKFKKCCLH